MVNRSKRFLVLAGLAAFTALGYNNCGISGKGSFEVNSSSSIGGNPQLNAACDLELSKAFVASYRPILNSPGLCQSCHVETGISPYKFAANDVNLAFNTFKSVGVNRIEANGTSTTHAPPITGPANATRFATARPIWDAAMVEYNKCLQAGGVVPDATPIPFDGAIVSDMKNVPDLYFGEGNIVAYSWDLSGEATPASARFPGVMIVDVRVTYAMDGMQKIATGYTFSNPRLRMLTGEVEADVSGVVMLVNGVKVTGIEPFLSAEKVVHGIDAVTIYAGEVKAPFAKVSSADKISIGFTSLKIRARTDSPPVPASPTLTIKNPFVNAGTVNVAIANDSTIRRWCLTASTAPITSTADPCPGYEQGTTSGWSGARPTAFNLTSLGRTPNQGEVLTLSLWVANSDLKMNPNPVQATFTYDIAAPVFASYSDVVVTDTQIAEIIGLGDADEPVTWCVLEDAIKMNIQNGNGCTFKDTKPRYVGLKGSGLRYVAVFAKDRAGNRSVSTIKSVQNPYAPINFTQLTSSSVGARGVFVNRCFSCHGSGQANQNVWDATSYQATVGNANNGIPSKKSQILNRIENTTSPQPPTGLLEEKERALIELWLSPSVPAQ